jgi:hypothetical protein
MRASTSAGRQSAPRASTAGAKRNPGDDEVFVSYLFRVPRNPADIGSLRRRRRRRRQLEVESRSLRDCHEKRVLSLSQTTRAWKWIRL